MWSKLSLLAAAGALGALARYGLTGLVQRAVGAGFPWATVLVNVVGCFVFGVVWVLGQERMALSPETRTILLVGFLGAFTTFSTFAFETADMLEGAQYMWAAGNVAVQTVVGVVAVMGGVAVARLV